MDKFSVCQFFHDSRTYEYVRQNVSAEEAIKAFRHYISSVAARFGVVIRVIVTDSGDCIVAEWKKGEGIVFPPNGDDR